MRIWLDQAGDPHARSTDRPLRDAGAKHFVSWRRVIDRLAAAIGVSGHWHGVFPVRPVPAA